MSERTIARWPNWMLAGIAFFAVAQAAFGIRYYLHGQTIFAIISAVIVALLAVSLWGGHHGR